MLFSCMYRFLTQRKCQGVSGLLQKNNYLSCIDIQTLLRCRVT
jgi:hypothetical protein